MKFGLFAIGLFWLGLTRIFAAETAIDCPAVSGMAQATNDFALVHSGMAAAIVYDSADAKVVEITSGLFAADIQRVTGVLPIVTNSLAGAGEQIVLIGSIGHSSNLDSLIAAGKINVSAIQGGWERYQIQVVENPFPSVTRALVIAGSDRRGAAYGTFSLSEAMGVSPWYWWADVPVRTNANLFVSAAPFISNEPSVRYRGIFINDEDWGLSPWAKKNFEAGGDGVQDIGPKTYAKVFELLLRLKANYIWPAMHPVTAAFNHYTNDPVVADNYAIVMGSSHAEPMLRDNDYEWNYNIDPTTGATWASGGSFNYSGNSNAVYRYWDEGAVKNGSYENVWPLGKRGIGDSAMPESSSTTGRASWLNAIFKDQEKILSNRVNSLVSEVPQMFTPYKEVLDVYNTGLLTNLPNYATIGWPDDNFGYIRRLSNPTERLRSGGGGVYYHVSYWGSPADYLWICSTPPSLIWEEMTKAYAYNCGRIWILNVGDIKPAEIDMEFFLRLAWNVHRYGPNAQSTWFHEWAAREFGSSNADSIASVLNDYYQLGYARKPEHMNWLDNDPNSPAGPHPLFSNVHYGDEAAGRLAAYSNLVARAQTIYAGLPTAQQSAFFEMVLYPVLGADAMNRKFLNCEKAYVASIQNRNSVTNYSAASQRAYNDIQTNTVAYNQLQNGKWNYIMSSNPRSQAVFNQPALPPSPVLSAGVLGVALEGQMAPSFVGSSGVTNTTITLNAATDAVLTAPMIITNVAGLQATWTVGSTGVSYPVGSAGKATYSFNISTAGTYTLTCEINCPTVNDDSWYIQMDNGSANTWNNLANGGVWGWAVYGTFNLTAGQHTLTVYEREDGAAMAAIKLTTGSPAFVEDNSQTSFQLPEFNRCTRAAHFIDLFDTGTGAVNWQIAAADPWLKVSQKAGSLTGDTRLWVWIDWTNAPQSNSLSSSLTISSAGGSVLIPVQVWNPAMQLPLTTDFVEDNHAVAIEAEHYSRRNAAGNATWDFLPNLGSGDGVMMVSPVTAGSRSDISAITNTSPSLEYNVYLRSAGAVSVSARFIPTLAINNTLALRYAVSFDGDTPQIVDMNRTSGSGNDWSRSVLRASVDYTTSHTVTSPGTHTLKIWMVDPGVVLDRVVIATDALPYTYGGPPETKIATFGAVTITNGQTSIESPTAAITCDSLTNNGSLVLLGNAQLNVNGAFINNGVLDIMTWQGTLPEGFINNGTILDRNATKIGAIPVAGNDLHFTIQGYQGHNYQLQQVDGLMGSWINVGDPVAGENAPISITVTNAFLTGKTGFYRMFLNP